MATNTQSQFSPFRLELENDITITGIHHFPSPSSTSPTYRPLIVLLHGGTCTAHNFDISPSLTASTAAESLSIPVISINRPGYLESTPLPIPSNSTFHKELGRFLHSSLLPALWQKYGIRNNCTALVPLAHSLGSPGIIVAAALHAQDQVPKYPLAGIIFSGWGIHQAPNSPAPPSGPSEKLAWKQLIMLGRPELYLGPSEAVEALGPHDHDMDPAEPDEIYSGHWWRYWRSYSDEVIVPVMFGQPEHDLFWEGTPEHVREVEGCFPKAARFDASLVMNAPHALEWSYCAAGWYARCFGFALEVTTAYALKGMPQPGKSRSQE